MHADIQILRFNCVLILPRAWESGLEADDRDRNLAKVYVSITYAFPMCSSDTYANYLQCAASPSGADTLCLKIAKFFFGRTKKQLCVNSCIALNKGKLTIQCIWKRLQGKIP